MAGYVRLTNEVDPIAHKRPVERDWQVKHYEYEDALRWAMDGYGVGVILSGDLAVIDIDGEPSDASFKDWVKRAHKAGMLLSKTLRGYHVFVRASDLRRAGVLPGKYDWAGVSVEVYDGSSTRQVVLPVPGTPRVKLGGFFAKGWTFKNVDEYINNVDNKDTFEVVKELKMYIKSPSTTSMGAHGDVGDGEVHRGRLSMLLGKRWWESSWREAVEVMQRAKRGERHNVFLSISTLFAAMGWDSDNEATSELFNAAKEAWGAEYDEAEVMKMWQTRTKVGLELKEHAERVKKRAEGRQARRVRNVVAVYEEVFDGDEVSWVKKNGITYVLHDGYAISEGYFLPYLLQRGHVISENMTKQLFSYVIANTQVNWDATIVGNYVVTVGKVLMVTGRVGNEVGVIVRDGEVFNFVPIGQMEGVYVRYADRYRNFTEWWRGDIDEYVSDYLKAIKLMTGKGDTLAALLANIIVGTARGGVIITGVAGSGKSTINLFLQLVAQGDGFFVNLTDKRDVVAALVNNKIVGLDENDSLDDATQEVLKSIISYGKVQQRELFTTNDVATYDSDASVVLSSVEVHKLQADLLRRCVVVNIDRKRNVVVPEGVLFDAMNREKEKYLLAAMKLATIPEGRQAQSLTALLEQGITESMMVPAYLRDVSKYDLAYTYYNTCKGLNLDDEAIRGGWLDLRGNMYQMALDGWGDILNKFEIDKEFAERLSEGMQAMDIAAALDVDLDARKGFAMKISKSAGRIEPILSELGYQLDIYMAASNYTRKKVKKFALKKKMDGEGSTNVQLEEEKAPF